MLGRWREEWFSEKPLIKVFKILGILGLSCQIHLSQESAILGDFQHPQVSPYPDPFPCFICSVPRGLKVLHFMEIKISIL